MKPPKQCTCHVHQTADYSKYSRDPKLLRRVRRNSLERALQLRMKASVETDPKERDYLEMVAICGEWSAWICLLRLREIKKEATV